MCYCKLYSVCKEVRGNDLIEETGTDCDINFHNSVSGLAVGSNIGVQLQCFSFCTSPCL